MHEAKVVSVYEGPSLYARVIKLASKLIPVMDRENAARYGVLIIDDKTLNAYVFDFTICVHTGMLNALSDEELMCVLAHEIAHMSLGHLSKKIDLSRSKDAVFNELQSGDPDAGLLSLFLKPFAMKAYSRKQELEADSEALRAVRSIGIQPEVCIAMMIKLRGSTTEQGGGLLDDHPSTDARIGKMKNMLQ